MSAKKFKREVLLRAPRFAKYQQDFLGAVLCKSEYTIACLLYTSSWPERRRWRRRRRSLSPPKKWRTS